ncbi:hypothetical protein Vretimale_7826 [Volvox reticuliferus]|uniref:Uncharacterized protein n=1 Tax=Volvox reticuliferus TaxID=1737510 RepID=A0A8J4LMJ6_9CHLO|nr:hypothetical protein Vretimale_7826 [Volvox reticuliferus]
MGAPHLTPRTCTVKTVYISALCLTFGEVPVQWHIALRQLCAGRQVVQCTESYMSAVGAAAVEEVEARDVGKALVVDKGGLQQRYSNMSQVQVQRYYQWKAQILSERRWLLEARRLVLGRSK